MPLYAKIALQESILEILVQLVLPARKEGILCPMVQLCVLIALKAQVQSLLVHFLLICVWFVKTGSLVIRQRHLVRDVLYWD
jgi:hypothetical protein